MGVDEFVTGGDVQNPAVESLETEEVVDAQDGAAWETLREMGVEEGDVVPFFEGHIERAQSSTTSTSLEYAMSRDAQPVRDHTNLIFDNIYVRTASSRLDSNAELSIQFGNTFGNGNSSRVIGGTEVVGDGSPVVGPWAKVENPPSPDNQLYAAVFRSTDGNTASVRGASVEFGVQL